MGHLPYPRGSSVVPATPVTGNRRITWNPVARARLITGCCLCGLFALAGCSQVKWVEVSGKATVDGKPLTKAAVFFAPDKDNTLQMIPFGKLDENGVYHLTTGDRKGAPVGWYKVFVDYEHKKGDQAPSPVHPKYLDASKTTLSVEVVENPETGAYDLKFSLK
jgi:hypothetical protein